MICVRTMRFSRGSTRGRMRAGGKLDMPLADIDYRVRGGGQRFLLPTPITRADLKPIVIEQGFHLLRKDVAQSRTERLLLALTSCIEEREMAGVVLDLGQRVVVLLFAGQEVPPIRQRILRRIGMEDVQEISWIGIACFKEKTSLRLQMLADASQHRFLVLSREKELKDIFQHVNERKLLPKMEGAGIGHHPFNREVLLRRLLARPFDHLWRDIHPRDLVAKLRHAKSHASSSTCQIQQWSTKRPRPLLSQGIIVIIALVYQIIGLRISKFFKRIIINHHCPFRALLVRHRIDRFSEKYTRWGADSPGEGRAIRILQVNFPLSGHLPSRRGAIGSALGNGTPLFSISLCSHEGEGPGPF